MSTQYEMIYMKKKTMIAVKDEITKRRKNNDDQLYCIKKYFDKNVKKK